MKNLKSILIALTLFMAACAGGNTLLSKPPSGTVRAALDAEPPAAAPAVDPQPRGPHGLSMVSTKYGEQLDLDNFQTSAACAECHVRQWKEMKGSMHSVAHKDKLYRAVAELARAEAGPEVYGLCSGCHTPQGVASGLVPHTAEEDLPSIVTDGIVCDTCHQVSALSGEKGPWKEPGNASLVYDVHEERRFGPPEGDNEAADHEVETRDYYSSSRFCANCHTVIHPTNGLRLEHTYEEWENSVYAKNNIQCQDCHMRDVEDAITVARTLKPVPIRGASVEDGDERPIARHRFVGGNINADLLGGGKEHAGIARDRLKSAARLELTVPGKAQAGKDLAVTVTVENIGAGHNLPTSLVELREMWVELKVLDAGGREVFRSGWLEENGDVEGEAMRFGALAGDKDGKVTYKPWEATRFLWKRLIPPKGKDSQKFTATLPADSKGPLQVKASLQYRQAPPKLVKALLGEQTILRQVEMASALASVDLAD